MQLIEKGLLQFIDRIVDIIDLRGTKIPNDVTIAHLLTHTSGIADDADITSIILGNQTCNVWELHWKVEQVILTGADFHK